jgi:hypothetical protein
VAAWNAAHPASELPGYDAVEAVDEAIFLQAQAEGAG